jgi:hypothetical protein
MSQQPIDQTLLDNVQGDILVGIPKKTQLFSFFTINADQIDQFRSSLNDVIPLITTGVSTQQAISKIVAHKRARRAGLVSLAAVNIAFSHSGLAKVTSSSS